MQLRNHPDWPPAWIWTDGPGNRYISGEIGTLERTQASSYDGKRCFITIRYQNSSYIGGLNFDAAHICRKVCEFLDSHSGQPIEIIAQLEIPTD